MTTLYFCEKPSQARVLAKILGASKQDNGAFFGDDIIVANGFGHMVSLAMPDAYIGNAPWESDDLPILPNEWKWVVNPKHRDKFIRIGELLAQSDLVIIATDPDEEGEVAGRQILAAHGYSGHVLRLWASALDTDSLNKALKNLLPLSATEHYYQAGLIRHKLDWLLGMNLSREYSIRSGNTVGIGRVKTRMLSELIQRETEINSFQPTTVFNAHVALNGHDFSMTSDVKSSTTFPMDGVCIAVIDETILLDAPLPPILSDLLIMANQSTGISLADGYCAAQMLYEAGLISYPRTSSNALPSNASNGFAAHHAIIVTNDECPSWADSNMRAIFNEVQVNGVMQDLGCAKIFQRTTIFEFGGKQFKNVFQSTTEDEAGWMLCASQKLKKLLVNNKPNFTKGQTVKAGVKVSSTQSVPPAMFSESSLLKMMVDNEVGTEATRVETITDLVKDKVAIIDGNGEFQATLNGRKLMSMLPSWLNAEMNQIVKEAVFQARRNCGDGQAHLLGATKWLAKVIHGSAGCSC
jgi:DNA topoisomerase-3